MSATVTHHDFAGAEQHSSTQVATLAMSKSRVDRARAYAERLDAHAAEVREKLNAAAGDERAGLLRGELVELQRRCRLAAAVLADIEAEHARHTADLRTMYGADGEARAKLSEAHQERATAQTDADAAQTTLERAKAHAEAVEDRLAAARADEIRHDSEATARLAEALRDGLDAPTTESFRRTSPELEDDSRAARVVVDRLAAEHAGKLAALAETDRKVRGTVDAVMLSEADVMAREVAALDARAALLRARLTTYTERSRGDFVSPVARAPDPTRTPWSPPPVGIVLATPTRIMSSPAIAAALVDRSFVQDMPRDTSREAATWSAFAAALTRDADAVSTFTPDPLDTVQLPVSAPRFPASFDPQPVIPTRAA